MPAENAPDQASASKPKARALPEPPPHPVFCQRCKYELTQLLPTALANQVHSLACPECGLAIDPATEPHIQWLLANPASTSTWPMFRLPVFAVALTVVPIIGAYGLMLGVPILFLFSPWVAFGLAKKAAWHEAINTYVGDQAFDKKRLAGKTVVYTLGQVALIAFAAFGGCACSFGLLGALNGRIH